MTNLIASPCCHPHLTLAEALQEYAGLGFRKFELFTGWARSSVDFRTDPEPVRTLGERYGIAYASFHLPPVDQSDLQSSISRAVAATRYAVALGVSVVIFKGNTQDAIIRAASPFLDAIADLDATPVLQNHVGTAISSLEDFRRVLAGIADSRMHTLLELGHFHAADVSWIEAWELLGDSVALVHLKDMVGTQSVPFGTGDIDLPAFLEHLQTGSYRGDYVVEMEVADPENTSRYLAEARQYLANLKGIQP